MPVTNTGVGVFSVGRDCTLVLVGPFGRVDLPNVLSFDAKPQFADVKSDLLDGRQLRGKLPKGWNGTITLDRAGPGLDDLTALVELGWFTTGTITNGTLYQYVAEPDGSTSTYQFDNVAFNLSDTGSWTGDAAVKQTITFEANRRRKV